MSNGSTPTVVKSNGTGSFMTVILGVILSGVIGFGAAEWRNRQAADFESVTLPCGSTRTRRATIG